jgi:glyoxylase-like metal-dependent hydrolase (beta-lactamase superfamily II)
MKSRSGRRLRRDAQLVEEVLSVRHCPGHTPGHVVFHSASATTSSGWTRSASACGRWGDDTVFVPGHGPESTIGRKRRGNPYVADEA